MIALNTDLEIWPTPPLIFTQKLQSAKFGIWDAVVSKRSNYRLTFVNSYKFNDVGHAMGHVVTLWRSK